MSVACSLGMVTLYIFRQSLLCVRFCMLVLPTNYGGVRSYHGELSFASFVFLSPRVAQ